MAFNPKYYHGNKMHQLRPPVEAFATYVTSDNIVIGIFQGGKGTFPELDFKVRILFDGEDNIPLLPPHTYWVVDLMLKCVNYAKEVSEIANYYIEFYDKCNAIKIGAERIDFKLTTRDYINKQFGAIENQNTLSLDYVAIMIELFCVNEKLNPGAYWFKDLLMKIRDYADGKANYVELLEAAKPGFQ